MEEIQPKKKYPFMFWAVPQEAIKNSELQLEEAVLLGILATRLNGENKAWPTQRSLAENMARSIRTVQRIISNLEKNGWIEIFKKANGNIDHYILPKLGFGRCECHRDSLSPCHPCQGEDDIDVALLKKEEKNNEKNNFSEKNSEFPINRGNPIIGEILSYAKQVVQESLAFPLKVNGIDTGSVSRCLRQGMTAQQIKDVIGATIDLELNKKYRGVFTVAAFLSAKNLNELRRHQLIGF